MCKGIGTSSSTLISQSHNFTCHIYLINFHIHSHNVFFWVFLQNEGPAVWIPSQEMSSLRLNSLYNLPPHGQHVAFPPAQAGHSAFSGIYSGQPLAASSPMLQHSQAMAGAVETVAPPSGVFQQPQHAQMNWISNF